MPGSTRASRASGIDCGERVHVARVVEDYGDVDALAGEAGARAARQNGGSGGAAGSQSGFDIGGVAGKDDANGKLAVIGRVGGVQCARAEIEVHFAAKAFLEQGFELAMSGEAFVIERGGIGEDGKGRSAHDGMVARCGQRVRVRQRAGHSSTTMPRSLSWRMTASTLRRTSGRSLGAGRGRFGDGDHAAIAPSAGRDGDDGLVEVGEAQLEFLSASGLGAEQGSLADRAGIGVGQKDAKGDDVGADGKKWVGPRGGVVDIDVKALGGQRNLVKLGALGVALGGGGLGLMLGFFGVLGNALDGLLFFVAGNEREGQKQSHRQGSSKEGTQNHEIKDSRMESGYGLDEGQCRRSAGKTCARSRHCLQEPD